MRDSESLTDVNGLTYTFGPPMRVSLVRLPTMPEVAALAGVGRASASPTNPIEVAIGHERE